MTTIEHTGAPARPLTRTRALYDRAREVIPGGVSSDARRMDPVPLFVDRAQGARLWDVDGTEYVDYVIGQGALVLGHSAPAVVDAVREQLGRGQAYSAQHEREVELAEEICRLVPCAERVRFNSVGSEAVHAAWRLARAYTGRERILKFEGHYHGWLDPALYSLHPPLDAAGRREAPRPVPGSPGQPRSSAGDIVVAPWNDLDALAAQLEHHAGQIAAVVAEPLLCNTGCIAPDPGFLEGVRRLCDEHGALLIFDEVITGFRLAPGGAQEHFGVTPDLAVFGKAIAGGFPLSCLAGRAEVMDLIARGEVGHAGTFNANPVAVAAATATLRELTRDGGAAFARMEAAGRRLADGIDTVAREAGVPLLVDGPGAVLQTYLTSATSVRDYRDFAATDLAGARRLHAQLLDRGINIVPRGLWFLSAAHGDADIDEAVNGLREVLATW